MDKRWIGFLKTVNSSPYFQKTARSHLSFGRASLSVARCCAERSNDFSPVGAGNLSFVRREPARSRALASAYPPFFNSVCDRLKGQKRGSRRSGEGICAWTPWRGFRLNRVERSGARIPTHIGSDQGFSPHHNGEAIFRLNHRPGSSGGSSHRADGPERQTGHRSASAGPRSSVSA